MTGYDMKRIMSDSSAMYWSGNNNQIYRTLVQLHRDGWVTSDVQLSENSPMKKVYSITQTGLSQLKDWVGSIPEAPDARNIFLVQLAWSDMLSADELDTLLSKYEDEIASQLMMQKERIRRGIPQPGRTAREAFLWQAIEQNRTISFESELAWVQELRLRLEAMNEEGG